MLNYDRVPSDIRPVQESTSLDHNDGGNNKVPPPSQQQNSPPSTSTNNYDTVWNDDSNKNDVAITEGDPSTQVNPSYVNLQCAGQGTLS